MHWLIAWQRGDRQERSAPGSQLMPVDGAELDPDFDLPTKILEMPNARRFCADEAEGARIKIKQIRRFKISWFCRQIPRRKLQFRLQLSVKPGLIKSLDKTWWKGPHKKCLAVITILIWFLILTTCVRLSHHTYLLVSLVLCVVSGHLRQHAQKVIFWSIDLSIVLSRIAPAYPCSWFIFDLDLKFQDHSIPLKFLSPSLPLFPVSSWHKSWGRSLSIDKPGARRKCRSSTSDILLFFLC